MITHCKRPLKALLLSIVLAGSFFIAPAGFAADQDGPARDRQVYKKTSQGDLAVHIFYPKDWKASDRRSAIVFFFGGGWVGGAPKQFFEHCKHFASRGMVAISAEYRIRKTHGTTPFECVADGKGAIRWVRANSDKLGVDPQRIVASGGSAGGHVAACTGVIRGYEEKGEDPRTSSKPDAMILFNPVIDTSQKGYGYNKLHDRWKELSPAHHVRKGIVPTLIFHGTADKTVPHENVERFAKLMKESKNNCILVSFDGKGHGFFNYGRDKDNASYKETVKKADEFLVALGYLKKKQSAD